MAHVARTTARAGALLGAAAVGAWAALLPRILKWGATDDEVVRPMPGDQLVDNPMYATTRAVTVAAPAAAVWPWLVQIGQNRGGFYSYDFFENVFRLDIHNADRVHEEWQDLRLGEDYVTLDPDGAMKLTIAVMDPERAFVILAGAPGEPPQEPGSFFRGELAFSWGFYLEPLDDTPAHPHACRLGRHHSGQARQAHTPRARTLPHGRTHAARDPRPRRGVGISAGLTASAGSFVWQGHRLAYREAGSPGNGLLLLLPGSGAASASHAGELAHFGRTYQVAALDFLGTGGSDRIAPWPPTRWELGAEQATALAAHLGADRYAVMGVSGGGAVALLTALHAPGQVAAVIADSCVERLSPEELEYVVHQRDPDTHGMTEAREGRNSEAGDLILGRGVLSLGRRLANKRLAGFWETAHGRDWQDVVAADSALLLGLAASGGWDPFAGRLGEVRCPVLLTGCSADELLPGLDARQAALAAQIPECRRAFFTGGGHPAMWTCAREFRRAADAFLGGLEF